MSLINHILEEKLFWGFFFENLQLFSKYVELKIAFAIFLTLCYKTPAASGLTHDKSIKVIYNASAYELERNEKIRKFLKYVSTNEPGEDDFTKRLSATVEMIKENDKFRSDYAAMNLHDYDITTMAKEAGREEGIAEGALNKAIEAAKNLLRMKVLSHEQIAQAQELPLEKVQELAEEIVAEKEKQKE